MTLEGGGVTGRVVFGDFVLDLDTRELLRGSRRVPLSPKAFHLLGLLVEHRPKALSKSDLQERLWPGTFVVEKNLTNLVAEIRDALGDEASDPVFVRTVHRFGYAFQTPRPRASGAAEPDARAAARFRLVWAGARAALRDGEHIIGRGPDVELFVDAASVSRRHARITVSGDEATVEDLGSTNGTFVCERRIESAAPLADGDVIRIGAVELTFYAIQAPSTSETRPI
jgi:DNA-binding winged helix-turn-helix (wHTH) protein